jgi:rhodanese-related sulfurtransferase
MSSKTARIIVIAVVAVLVVLVATLVLTRDPVSAPSTSSTDAVPTLVSGLITPQQYTSTFVDGDAPHQLIDVRTPEEFASGHLPNAINIPLQEMSARLDEVAQDEPVVLYCRSGNRSNQAAQLLGAQGFSQVLDLGGIQAWEAAGLPVVQ